MKTRYNVIIKVGEQHFIKYRNVSNLLRLTSYLDRKHPTWRWFNVYDAGTSHQVASYTRKNRPGNKWV